MPAVEREVSLVNPHGLHARPISRVVELSRRFQAQVEIEFQGRTASGRSVLELMSLGAGPGSKLTLRADGPDAEGLVDALDELIAGGFGEP